MNDEPWVYAVCTLYSRPGRAVRCISLKVRETTADLQKAQDAAGVYQSTEPAPLTIVIGCMPDGVMHNYSSSPECCLEAILCDLPRLFALCDPVDLWTLWAQCASCAIARTLYPDQENRRRAQNHSQN